MSGCLYFLGLGLGLLPLLALLLGIGLAFGGSSSATSNLTGTFSIIAIFLYLAAIIAAIVCLFFRQVRFMGYGLLTAVIITPVAAVIGCVVVLKIGTGG